MEAAKDAERINAPSLVTEAGPRECPAVTSDSAPVRRPSPAQGKLSYAQQASKRLRLQLSRRDARLHNMRAALWEAKRASRG